MCYISLQYFDCTDQGHGVVTLDSRGRDWFSWERLDLLYITRPEYGMLHISALGDIPTCHNRNIVLCHRTAGRGHFGYPLLRQWFGCGWSGFKVGRNVDYGIGIQKKKKKIKSSAIIFILYMKSYVYVIYYIDSHHTICFILLNWTLRYGVLYTRFIPRANLWEALLMARSLILVSSLLVFGSYPSIQVRQDWRNQWGHLLPKYNMSCELIYINI